MRPPARTCVTTVRVGSRVEGSSCTPSRSAAAERSSTTLKPTALEGPSPPSRTASSGSSGAGPECHRRSVIRVRRTARRRARTCAWPTSGSLATMRSPGAMGHLPTAASLRFHRSTARPGVMPSILSTLRPPEPLQGICSRSSMPQPSCSKRSTSASQTPGAACAAGREKRSVSFSMPAVESHSIINPTAEESFTATRRSEMRTAGFRTGDSATARLWRATSPSGASPVTSSPPTSSRAGCSCRPTRSPSPRDSSTWNSHRKVRRLSRSRASKLLGSRKAGAQRPSSRLASGGCSWGAGQSCGCRCSRGGRSRRTTVVFESSAAKTPGSLRPFTATTTEPATTCGPAPTRFHSSTRKPRTTSFTTTQPPVPRSTTQPRTGLSSRRPMLMPSFWPTDLWKGPQITSCGAGCRGSTPRTIVHDVAMAVDSRSTDSILSEPDSRFTATTLSPLRTCSGGFLWFQRASGPEEWKPATSRVSLPSSAGVIWHPHISSADSRRMSTSTTHGRMAFSGRSTLRLSDAELRSSCIMPSQPLAPLTPITKSSARNSCACHQLCFPAASPAVPARRTRWLWTSTAPPEATPTT
mmetsp:Transcript_46365/g.148039  ORF Transcript_46365/g.148039 Transcript_46365/m.148039 type:complete len:583 (-) Transcript_46365:546-2294(-)